MGGRRRSQGNCAGAASGAVPRSGRGAQQVFGVLSAGGDGAANVQFTENLRRGEQDTSHRTLHARKDALGFKYGVMEICLTSLATMPGIHTWYSPPI